MSRCIADLRAAWDAHAAAPLPRSWAEFPSLYDAGSLEEIRVNTRVRPQAIFRSLLLLTQSGDQLAPLALAHLLTPKLLRLAHSGRLQHIPTALDDLVSSTFLAAMRYDVSTRHGSIPGSLALDALRETLELHQLLRDVREVPTGDQWTLDYPVEPEPTAREQALELIDEGGLSPDLSALMTAVYVSGLSGAEAAARWQCQPATVRSRCRTGVTKLRERTNY